MHVGFLHAHNEKFYRGINYFRGGPNISEIFGPGGPNILLQATANIDSAYEKLLGAKILNAISKRCTK